MAAAGPHSLAWANQFVSPLIDSLHFIGYGIVKPFMDGPLPPLFYRNITGIGVLGALAYHVVTILWLFINKPAVIITPKIALQRLMDKKGWGPVRAWFALEGVLLFLVIPFGAWFTAMLLNGIHGWIVFHVKDLLTPIFTVMLFLFPGAFILAIWITVFEHLVYDLSQAVQFIFRV